MLSRWSRVVSLIVTIGLVVSACGGGSDEASSEDESPGPRTSADTSIADGSTDVPPLIVDGVVNADALAAVTTADGEPDAEVLTTYIAELTALSLDEQEAAVAELALLTELEAARISGLEAAVGDRDTTAAALAGAGAQVEAAIDADAEAFAATPDGFRRPSAAAAPSAGTIAAAGLFMGYLALATFGSVGTQASNTIKPGDTAVQEGTGSVQSASVDEVNAEITFTGKQDGVDVDFTAATTIHPCPEPDGSFTIGALVDVKASKDGAGQNATMELKVTGTVDDNAELASKNIENHTQWSDFGGGKGQFIDVTMSGAYGAESSTTNRTGGTLTAEFVNSATLLSALIGAVLATQLISAAEKGWKSGRCVELKVTPSAGPDGLSPAEVVNVLAEPRSKVDGSPTGGNVTATLSAGGASVEPNGSPVPADANSNYTAPDEEDKSGTVSYESRSRRGVGTASIAFSTERAVYAYQIAGGKGSWNTNTAVCDVREPFTLTGGGFAWEFTGGLTGQLTFTGPFNTRGSGSYTISLPDGPGQPGTLTSEESGTTMDRGASGSITYTLTPITC